MTMHECMHIQWSDVEGSTLQPHDFINIKVSGVKYETMRTTLERFPNTLLGSEYNRHMYFVPSRNSYFLDRCRVSFEAVLYYYQSGGILVRPPSVPMDVFEEEIKFYDLGEDVLLKLKEEEGFIVKKQHDELSLMSHGWKRNVWMLFEYPDSSLGARIVSFCSIFIICFSITVCTLETMPVFRLQMHAGHNGGNTLHYDPLFQRSQMQPWFSFELGCVLWFVIEYIARLLSSPSKYKFLLSFLNIVDLVAIVPYILMLGMNTSSNATPLSVLRIVRLVRLFRIFKLSRHSMSLQILGDTLRASVRELGMLMFFLFLGVVAFSSALFYAERGDDAHLSNSTHGYNSTFNSIPDAFWFSLVTMTTVGYGEIVPLSSLGKLIGGACALTGVLTLALPVPVIVSNFEYFYKKDQLVKGKGNEEEERLSHCKSQCKRKVTFVSSDSPPVF